VTYYAKTGGEHGLHAWVGRLGDRVVMFEVGGATGVPSEESVTDVGTALLAGLQEDASYQLDPALNAESGGSASGYSTGSLPATPHQMLSEQELGVALAGWSSWEARGDATRLTIPCLSTNPAKAQSGSSQSVGTTAEMTFHDFASTADAAGGMQQLLAQLASCNNGPWDLDSTTVPGAVVASYPHGVAWVAQQGKTVGVLTIGEATDPPTAVKLSVGKLVMGSLP